MSISTAASDPPADPLAAYYADRPRQWCNVAWISIGNLGWYTVFAVVYPLMVLRLKGAGLSDWAIGLLSGINVWAAAILALYYTWKSDHTVSRFGRRTPYLMFSAPLIILAIALFPLWTQLWVLMTLFLLETLARDVQQSVYPLLVVDCVRKDVLARVSGFNLVLCGIGGFFALRHGTRLAEWHEAAPYWLGAALLTACTAAVVLFVREPLIRHSSGGRFVPWSGMRVALADRRRWLLFLGVGLINSFILLYVTWVWLFAKHDLNLERSQIGSALAWGSLFMVAVALPLGWLIDRFGSIPVLCVYWVLSVACFAFTWLVRDLSSLLTLHLMVMFSAQLYMATDMLVYKAAPVRDVGSFAGTNTFLRNVYQGALLFASGFVIQALGYRAAFVLGMAMSTAGIVLLLAYHYGMRAAREAGGAVSLDPQEQAF